MPGSPPIKHEATRDTPRVLDQLKLPVFVFEDGRQIYANDAAVELADRLRANDRIELRVVLVDHIAALESGRGGGRPAAASVSLLTSQSGEPFYLHVWPIARRGRGRQPPTYALSVRSSGADVAAFGRRYRLSARENQLVELIVRGQGNREIAQNARHRDRHRQEASQSDLRQGGRR